MKVYNGLSEFIKLPFAVVTAGTFDGIHKGHKKILKRLTEIASQENGESVVITYNPHPRQVLYPETEIKLLSTLEEKKMLLRNLGIDHLLIIPFTKEFSTITSKEYIEEILVKRIGTGKLIMGYDHRFGRKREGSFEYLKKNHKNFGFDVEEISREDIDLNAVSSTKIRDFINKGDVENVIPYLERPYSILGTVVHGEKIGRTLGYPTANIEIPETAKIVPADGIYAVKIRIDERMLNGMLSIGMRPTVGGTKRTIEVNIFNFSEEIYGKKIEVYFFKYLRPELKFNSLEELVNEMHQDKKNTDDFFGESIN